MFLCLFILGFAINHLLCWMWWGRGLLKLLNAYFFKCRRSYNTPSGVDKLSTARYLEITPFTRHHFHSEKSTTNKNKFLMEIHYRICERFFSIPNSAIVGIIFLIRVLKPDKLEGVFYRRHH